MKKIVLALTFVLVGSFMLAGCSKDEILNHYNNIVQSAGSIELTGKSSLQGEKEKGIDDYTGTYTADYANFSGTEYLFGGTSIKREAGKELSIDCTLEITEGTAKVFWISGSDEAVTLIEATGTYSDTITLHKTDCGRFGAMTAWGLKDTSSRPAKDLGGTLRHTIRTMLRSYDSRASGDLLCSHRQGAWQM